MAQSEKPTQLPTRPSGLPSSEPPTPGTSEAGDLKAWLNSLPRGTKFRVILPTDN
jgi:hypothetical protein